MQGRALIIFISGIGAVYVMLSVLLAGGNSIGALAQFLSIGSFIFALIQPRLALYLMVLYAGYIDLLKRMMIFDGHVTTLISCIALGWLGSGLVRGFAVTLSVGVLLSLFTALTCTRTLLRLLLTYPALRRPGLFLPVVSQR